MNVRQANQIKRCNYQYANASAKISAINRDAKKERARTNLERNGRDGGRFNRIGRA